MNNKIKALICGFTFSVILSMLNFYGKCESISDKVFRLHIIANSNSSQDQSLKLEVRDEILKNFSGNLSLASNLREAQKILESKIEEIKDTAQNIVHKKGFDYKVDVQITKSYFNIRKYNEVTLPSGFYKALKITLGNGNGKNWWCVMFPPICLSAAEEKSELETILNPAELDIVENESEYIIKLKLLEWLMETQIKIQKFISGIIDECTDFINESYDIGFKTQEMFQDIVFK